MENDKDWGERLNQKKNNTITEDLKMVIENIKNNQGKINGYIRITDFFNTDKQVKTYFDEIKEQCRKDNYFGEATMIIMTIEKLLEKIDDLEDDKNYYEKENTKLTTKIDNLEE